MAFDYSGFIRLANSQIADKGYTAKLVRAGEPTGPDYDPQPGEETAHDIEVFPISWKRMYRSETLVKAGDKFWMVTPDSEQPQMSDSIRVDDDVYQIVNLDILELGTANQLTTVHARK